VPIPDAAAAAGEPPILPFPGGPVRCRLGVPGRVRTEVVERPAGGAPTTWTLCNILNKG
jgi:hypothetical protein